MSERGRIRPFGDRGLLLELDGNDDVQRVAAAARARHGDALAEVVPGHRTVLLAWAAPPADRAIAEDVLGAGDEESAQLRRAPVVIDVVYDGPDLGDVARHAGISPEEVARRHAAAEYHAAFVGFAPGFAYLLGGDPKLRVPRRDDPRQRVPAGSVALAGRYAAVYPRESPGGWQLIGTTQERLFDPDRNPPALLEPGVEVRFRERGR